MFRKLTWTGDVYHIMMKSSANQDFFKNISLTDVVNLGYKTGYSVIFYYV